MFYNICTYECPEEALMDFESGTPEPASAVIEWGQRYGRVHVKASVSFRPTSLSEVRAIAGRLADRVPGMTLCVITTSWLSTTLDIRPTAGNSTVDGMKWVVERLGEALNLELNFDVRERDSLVDEDLESEALAMMLSLATLFSGGSRRRRRW
jgi:hypothetical protein